MGWGASLERHAVMCSMSVTTVCLKAVSWEQWQRLPESPAQIAPQGKTST